jgi:hypothetical protein
MIPALAYLEPKYPPETLSRELVAITSCLLITPRGGGNRGSKKGLGPLLGRITLLSLAPTSL